MNDLALRVGALVVFLAVLGGSFYAADKAFGHASAPGSAAPGSATIALAAVEPQLSAAPGTTVTFPVVLRGPAGAGELSIPGIGAGPGSTLPVTVPAGGVLGTWVPVVVPADAAPGAQRVVVKARVGNATGTGVLALTVLGPGPTAGIGDTVQADYVGRFDNGSLFDTSVQAVGEAAFEKPAGFARQQWQPLRMQLGDSAGTISGFWRGILGMQEGQTKTVHLAPTEAYGNATQQLDVPRTLEVPRVSQAFQRLQHVPRALVGQYLNASSQVGDVIHVADPQGNNRSYVVEQLDAGNATLRWVVHVGDTFTSYPSWPGQSHAVVVTNETAQFRTDPADLNATLTWYPFWPNASHIVSVNDTVILLRHDPAVGLTFALPARQGPGGQASVAQVTPTTIVVEAPNDHPLAGKALNFDITVRSLTKAR